MSYNLLARLQDLAVGIRLALLDVFFRGLGGDVAGLWGNDVGTLLSRDYRIGGLDGETVGDIGRRP